MTRILTATGVEDIHTVGIVGNGHFAEAIMHLLTSLHEDMVVRILTHKIQYERVAGNGARYRHYKDEELPAHTSFTSNPETFMQDVDALFVVTPSAVIRENLRRISSASQGFKGPVVSCVKSLEEQSKFRMSQVIADELKISIDRIIALSGPNYADDMMADKHMETVLAGLEEVTALIKQLLDGSCLEIQTSSDIIGTELCGAIKHMIAIMGGLMKVIYNGNENKIALLIDKGIRELHALLASLGGESATVEGPAGRGDVLLTVKTPGSRNEALGENLVTRVRSFNHETIEGTVALPGLVALGREHGIALPITYALNGILQRKQPATPHELRSLCDVLLRD